MHKNKNHHEDEPTLKKALKTLYGPDDLLGTAASTDPVSVVTCESTRIPEIDERNIHHTDLDDHTLHRLLGKSEQSPEHIQKHQSILAGISQRNLLTSHLISLIPRYPHPATI